MAKALDKRQRRCCNEKAPDFMPLLYRWVGMSSDVVMYCTVSPHVDEILGQGHGLAVAGDGDGAVQVGRGVAVLAIGDSDHGSGQLPGSWTEDIDEYF